MLPCCVFSLQSEEPRNRRYLYRGYQSWWGENQRVVAERGRLGYLALHSGMRSQLRSCPSPPAAQQPSNERTDPPALVSAHMLPMLLYGGGGFKYGPRNDRLMYTGAVTGWVMISTFKPPKGNSLAPLFYIITLMLFLRKLMNKSRVYA